MQISSNKKELLTMWKKFKESEFLKRMKRVRVNRVLYFSAIAILLTLSVVLVFSAAMNRAKKNEIEKLKATINENEVTINDLSEDIKKKVQMLNSKKNDIDSYYETEICKKILADIKYKNANKIKKIPLKKLKSKN